MTLGERAGRVLDLIVRREPANLRAWAMVWMTTALASAGFGVAMGSFDLSSAERWRLPVFAAMKAPMLVLVTTVLCLPGFFVLSTALGLRGTFARSIASIMCGQAAQALALCSLAPLLLFVYQCGITHSQALAMCAAMYGVATGAGYIVLLRRYRPLLEESRRHRVMLGYWLLVYVFVGIQTGWMLRPFVGSPGLEVAFVRREPFTNAYVEVLKIARAALGGSDRIRRYEERPGAAR